MGDTSALILLNAFDDVNQGTLSFMVALLVIFHSKLHLSISRFET